MFSASVSARSVIVLTCTATAMLTAWIIAAAPAVGPDEGRVRILVGQVRPLGDGTIRSWVRVDAHNKPTSIGVTFTEAALQNLPAAGGVGGGCCGGHEYALSLPTEASVRPFTHIVVNWNPTGHEPVEIYGRPHFDFHFYTIDPATRHQIKAEGEDLAKCAKPVPAGQIPTGYIQAPGGVMRMGAHWVDTAAPEFDGQIFTRTFIYGSYDGALAFIEPMITKAFLESHPNDTLAIKQPEKFAFEGGVFPKQYRAKYDAAAREYTVSLEGLTSR